VENPQEALPLFKRDPYYAYRLCCAFDLPKALNMKGRKAGDHVTTANDLPAADPYFFGSEVNFEPGEYPGCFQ
jgi:hypothetical protein